MMPGAWSIWRSRVVVRMSGSLSRARGPSRELTRHPRRRRRRRLWAQAAGGVKVSSPAGAATPVGASGWLVVQSARIAPQIGAEPAMPFADVAGIRLFYEEVGEGVPLIFVHEFAGDHRSWHLQVRCFSRRYRTIAYNARGYP